MKAKLRGTEIYFDTAGSQLKYTKQGFELQPVVFMLHGGPGGDHRRYKQHSAELADIAQLIYIDNRGCGQSKQTKQKDYSLKNNVEDVEALRKYLGLEQICLLGTSYGGIVAQAYAIKYPKRVQKLILVATSPSYEFLAEAKRNLHTRGTQKQIKHCEKLWQGKFKSSKEVIQFFKIMHSLYSIKKENPLSYANTKMDWSYQALNEGFAGFLQTFNLIPKLKKITAPTLILAGAKDWICPPSQAKTIAHQIPHAQLKIFANCSHAIAIDVHKKYIAIIKRFLAR